MSLWRAVVWIIQEWAPGDPPTVRYCSVRGGDARLTSRGGGYVRVQYCTKLLGGIWGASVQSTPGTVRVRICARS